MDDLLEVDLPADTPSLRVARLIVWEAAARGGLDCDSADDLCLALDEVCFAIFARTDDGKRLSLRIRAERGVHIEGRVGTAEPGDRVMIGNLGQTLVALAVDRFEIEERADGVSFVMSKDAPVLELR